MEYVGGGNLQQYVEAAGRLPEWQARCFFQQLILALQVGPQARACLSSQLGARGLAWGAAHGRLDSPAVLRAERGQARCAAHLAAPPL